MAQDNRNTAIIYFTDGTKEIVNDVQAWDVGRMLSFDDVDDKTIALFSIANIEKVLFVASGK